MKTHSVVSHLYLYLYLKENGEEKCVIETRSRSKSDCNGHCTQTCTVTPIKLDSCTGDITIDQPVSKYHY